MTSCHPLALPSFTYSPSIFFPVNFSTFLTRMFLPLFTHTQYLLVIFLSHFLNFHGPSHSSIKHLCFMLSLPHWFWGFHHRPWLQIGRFFFSPFPSVNCCFTALSHTSLLFDLDKYEKAASQKSFRGIILMFGLMGWRFLWGYIRTVGPWRISHSFRSVILIQKLISPNGKSEFNLFNF